MLIINMMTHCRKLISHVLCVSLYNYIRYFFFKVLYSVHTRLSLSYKDVHLPSLYYQQLVTVQLMFGHHCDPSPGDADGNGSLSPFSLPSS